MIQARTCQRVGVRTEHPLHPRHQGAELLDLHGAAERRTQRAHRCQLGVAVTEFVQDADRLPQVLEPLISTQCIGRGICRLLEQRHPLVTDGREVERLLQVAQCLSGCTKSRGPLRSPAEPVARAGGQRLGIGARWRGLERLQVVRGDHCGQLVIASRLEVVSGSQVSATTVGLGQHAVGDLADDALHEGVLTPLGGARIHLELHELLADKVRQSLLELTTGLIGHRRKSLDA